MSKLPRFWKDASGNWGCPAHNHENCLGPTYTLTALEVVALYESGKPLQQVAAAAGCSRNYARLILEAHGAAIRAVGRHSGLDRAQLAAKYRAGLTLAQLAKEHGVSTATVREHLIAAAEPRRRAGRPSKN